MPSNDFGEKVKRRVTENFDQSLGLYQAFEDKHRFFAKLTTKLAEKINLRPNTDVLDVGCGNGISSRTLNDHFGCRVLGVDLSSKMVADGQFGIGSENVRLVVGDGERLAEVVANQTFDYVLYNASIFIFPDVDRALREAMACLRPGGEIAFSFYPHLVGPADEDLLDVAFHRLGEPPPRFRVITGFDKACQALAHHCGSARRHQWVRPLDIEFLQDFFSIPAQSASLFPGMDYEARIKRTNRLFSGLSDIADKGAIVWRMARGKKPASV